MEKEKENVKEIVVEQKSGFNTIEVIIIIIIAILFGGLVGSFLTLSKSKKTTATIPDDLKEFASTYATISTTYYDKVDKSKLIDAAIKGMISELEDPYSLYMDETAAKDFNQTITGEYKGIGARLYEDNGNLKVFDVFSSSPAQKAGLQKDDILIEINGKSTKEKTISEITDSIKNAKKGTKFKIKVLRGEKEVALELTTSSVNIPSVESTIIEKDGNKIGKIRLDIFASNTCLQFKDSLNSLEKKGITSLIIDVRGNPGGHLNQVNKILSLFVKKGDKLYQIENKGKTTVVKDKTKTHKTYPIVVLTDNGSASASEIFAAAIKETYKGQIVGVKTYGKGTVQKAYSLESGASIKYTTERWLTPNGNSIDEKGVEPDYEISIDEKYFENPSDETDNQLQKAIEVITKK